MATLGGLRNSATQNSLEIDTLARFAIDEHNKKENALLEFARVVKAQEQVVSGTLHHLTLEVIESGKKKLYEAKGWVKPWMNFKELQEFKHVGDDPSCASSDLGVKKVRHIIITFQMARLDSLCLYYAFFVTDWCENQTSNARDGDQCRCMILLFKNDPGKIELFISLELREIVHGKAEVCDSHT
ncbi:cysteine inhibitor 1 [Olea europaea subsp. europaea]|uniref:Cysteine proteinase inhibitor n=1 Tax=Olea europaea subsp. europaea TaxID=158383 RepID=A0A8S0V9A0_OLEEU|nr:cysteine inhibitor 1 [Olea europaea subsp. europaea]